MLHSRLSLTTCLVLFSFSGSTQGQMRITEWMYQGSSPAGGEFVEFTNVGDRPIDMTGWSFDDDHDLPGTFDLSAFGIVQPGESVILTEDDAEDFRAAWVLGPQVKIIGDLGNPIGNNLGRNDEINLYDASGIVVDTLTYGDQVFPGSIRTRWFSGNPVSFDALGANDVYLWVLAAEGDPYGSWKSNHGDVGNPGVFTLLPPAEDVPVRINEVMASNNATLQDEDGDYPDWIELHHMGGIDSEPVALLGWGLSDNANNPFKWTLPDVTIAPGEYLVIFASNKDRKDPAGELHTNFAIAADGEEIVLTHPSGQLIDEMPAIPMPTDVSYGRQPDGSGPWHYFTEPTPGASNTTQGFTGLTPPVTFSHVGGFFTDAFALSLSCDDPNAVIYYTLYHGATPTPGEKETLVYNGPITIESRAGEPNGISMIPTNFITGNNFYAWKPPIGEVFKITPVRAVAIAPGELPSAVATHSYLVDPDIHNRYVVPVISLNTDFDNFFDDEIGIYVPGVHWTGSAATGNYFQTGIEWERPIHIEFFESGGELALAQDAGVRIHGGVSRRAPHKTLRLYARSEYGPSTFDHKLYPEQPYTQFKRFLLRNAGQDFRFTMFRDALIQSLAADLGVETQSYRPSLVFLNGEYWGLHNIRDRYDRHYIARVHSVDPDNIDLLRASRVSQIVIVEGDASHYLSLLNFVRDPHNPNIPATNENDLIHDENYEYVKTLMDVENYMDYMLTQVYSRNHDWPYGNKMFWREKVEGARWRWLMFDTERGWGYEGSSADDSFKRVTMHNQVFFNTTVHNWSTVLFRSLMRNEQFRHALVNRYADMMNTVYQPAYAVQRIDEMAAVIESSMPEHIARWDKITNWPSRVQVMRNYGNNRLANARQHVVDHFTGAYDGEPWELFYVDPNFAQATLTFENPTPERGHIRVNTVDLEQHGYPWSGVYFTTVPLPLHAVPNEGFHFIGWEGIPESEGKETYLYTPSGNATLKAVFGVGDAPTDPIPGDLTGNGSVGVPDLLILLSSWGACPPQPAACPADLNADGVVGVADLLILLLNWG